MLTAMKNIMQDKKRESKCYITSEEIIFEQKIK